jgi:hypothetical protein
MFSAGFVDISELLTKLKQDERVYWWLPEAEATFRSLKKSLYTSPVQGYLRPGEKFIIDMDVSNIVIGVVLSQMQDGHKRVVASYSKTLSRAERNYCMT